MSFGKRLKRIRVQMGLSQGTVAQRVKITTARLSLYENNRERPNIDTLVRLSDVLNVSVDRLLGRAIPLIPVLGDREMAMLEGMDALSPSQVDLLYEMYQFFARRQH